ncbi:hypothetical protein [Motilibacter deserti]|uniref:Uncharacterized protein n=1 Tax=Motilibacter deserti TaxID=2714956 RepID=A0ABX0GXN1_9ACTN|nr:hypothetical protein [Motilibacter deserti]NHC15747.1 hypothetical protein [Motilibacter deserti]
MVTPAGEPLPQGQRDLVRAFALSPQESVAVPLPPGPPSSRLARAGRFSFVALGVGLVGALVVLGAR